MNDKFKIIIMIKKIIDSYDCLVFHSKKELKLKNMIIKEGYFILKITYIANDSYDLIKKRELQYEILSRIKYLEYLTSKLKISDREYQRHIYDLNMISKYVYSWIKYTNKLV